MAPRFPFVGRLMAVLLAAMLLPACGRQITRTNGPAAATTAAIARHRPQLFMTLPDQTNNPDGMTLHPDTGEVYLACPNFNDPTYPGHILRIDRHDRATIWALAPVHPETGRGCPMGMDFGPDGNLYYADNQYFTDKNYKSRLMRIVVRNGQPDHAEVVADGFKLANAVIWRDNAVYVSDTFFDLPDKPGRSGIYRLTLDELNHGPVHLQPNATDPHLIALIKTVMNDREDPAGADGLTFDRQGNLYTGCFGDGAVIKITLDANGRATSVTDFVRDPRMTSADGLFYDERTGRIYVADYVNNAIRYIDPDRTLHTLWENGDDDGADGLLDAPAEVLLRGRELIIANFDMAFPHIKNTQSDAHHTLSVIQPD